MRIAVSARNQGIATLTGYRPWSGLADRRLESEMPLLAIAYYTFQGHYHIAHIYIMTLFIRSVEYRSFSEIVSRKG